MFTRLDSERNTQTLKTALEKDRISPTTYSNVTSSMAQYVDIPSKRLACMTRRCHDKAVARRLMEQVLLYIHVVHPMLLISPLLLNIVD